MFCSHVLLRRVSGCRGVGVSACRVRGSFPEHQLSDVGASDGENKRRRGVRRRVTDGPRVEHMTALHRLAAPVRAHARPLKMSVLVCVYWDTRVCVCPCTCPCSGAAPMFTWGSFWVLKAARGSVSPPVIPPFCSPHTSACHPSLY